MSTEDSKVVPRSYSLWITIVLYIGLIFAGFSFGKTYLEQEILKERASTVKRVVSTGSGRCGSPLFYEKRDRDLFVMPVRINGHEVRALIDTGASRTSVPINMMSFLKPSEGGMWSNEGIETATGFATGRVYPGQSIQVGGAFFTGEVVVLPASSDEAILGLDVLSSFNMSMSRDVMSLSLRCD